MIEVTFETFDDREGLFGLENIGSPRRPRPLKPRLDVVSSHMDFGDPDSPRNMNLSSPFVVSADITVLNVLIALLVVFTISRIVKYKQQVKVLTIELVIFHS